MTDYKTRFSHADVVIKHLNTAVIPGVRDHPLLEQKYAGIVSVLAVTVYELAIKDIFSEFAKDVHPVLGDFVVASLKRINGRIRMKNIRRDHLSKFGAKYKSRFNEILEKREREYLKENHRKIEASYGKVVTARHQFVHAENHSTSTFPEITEAYEDGKEIIHCLAEAMVR